MLFEIDFNTGNYVNDEFLINVLGAKLEPTHSQKYPPFEVLHIEVEDFKHLEEILKKVDEEFGGFSSAVISFDPPTIFLDVDDRFLTKTENKRKY